MTTNKGYRYLIEEFIDNRRQEEFNYSRATGAPTTKHAYKPKKKSEIRAYLPLSELKFIKGGYIGARDRSRVFYDVT